MKFVYSDLLSFLSKKPSREDLSSSLFQLGHEHEISDDVFDMELTPNRGDCLSLLGLARDLNVFFELNDKVDTYSKEIAELDFDFENLSPIECPKISFLEIEIEDKVSEYKTYLQNYFDLLGNKKANFFTDISNYISYEQGQPTHCYDKSKISKRLIFENKDCNETFLTLLDNKVELSGKNYVFSADNNILCLAGIMGGKATACSEKTKKVLVECAYFKPDAIIGKSVKYNLNSDAAYKFERGVDINSQERVLRRFISVVEDHAVIKNLKMKTFCYGKHENNVLPIQVDKINSILGTDLKENEYIGLLENLGFLIDDQITIPSYRNDVSSQNDLAEEIARVIGYNNIKRQQIHLDAENIKGINKIQSIEKFFCDYGFSEVINFPFSSLKHKDSITIDNPLDSNRGFIRTSLRESLIENLLYNERRQKDSIKIFEISDVYSKRKDINHEKRIGIIVSGRVGNNYQDFSKKLDEKYLETVLMSISEDINFEIHEIPREKLKTKKKERIFYCEIAIEKIPYIVFDDIRFEDTLNFNKYSPISEFPSSSRDFSFSITDLTKYDKVLNLIEDFHDDYLKESFVFDFYINKDSNEIKLGVRLIFQSTARTLSEENIQECSEKLLRPIITLGGVSVPGLEFK